MGALRAAGQRVVLHIASDGEASDGRISDQMAPLRNLPVWVVIRLCTDSDDVVSYWNMSMKNLSLRWMSLTISREKRRRFTNITHGCVMQRRCTGCASGALHRRFWILWMSAS